MAKLRVRSRYRFGRARVRDMVKSLVRELPSVLGLFGRLMADRRVSVLDKALVAGVVAYVLTPVDLIPDFLGLIGVVDDLFLLGIALDRLLARAPAEVVHEHWHGSRQGLLGLTAELQALGDALPGPVRTILLGGMDRGDFGQEADETLFERPLDEDELPSHDLHEDYDDEQGHMHEGQRVTPYRNRL